ncbi:MAG: hypothetical protein M1549_04100 [Candidatus Dependentiae bacterium]|nr:hypothetical protein [Candidatus Dependentiae bacterium]
MTRKALFLASFLSITLWTGSAASYHVGLLIVATGKKYITLAPPLIESARKHFLTNHQVTFFLFTDQPVKMQSDVVVLPHKQYGWPYDTLYRYCAYTNHRDILSTMDYLFAIDVDMLFVDTVGDEILHELVATQHPGCIGRRGYYETDIRSAAYVGPGEGEFYFAGAFYGGKTSNFFEMMTTILGMVERDAKNKVMPRWHDEAYNNRYFIDQKPTLVLSQSYCHPEHRYSACTKRIIMVGKNSAEMRSWKTPVEHKKGD